MMIGCGHVVSDGLAIPLQGGERALLWVFDESFPCLSDMGAGYLSVWGSLDSRLPYEALLIRIEADQFACLGFGGRNGTNWSQFRQSLNYLR